MVTSRVQGQVAAAGAADAVADAGLPEQHLRVGPGPPGAPQVHRYGRRPAQRPPRLLLLAHWLADGEEAPGREAEGSNRGHERFRAGPGRDVPEEVS